MSLIRKRATSKFVAAVQNNGRQSQGPRTDAGKRHSSLNAIKHGAFAQVGLPHMRALGENPEEFAQLLSSLVEAFAPQDGYEDVLVKEMAELHWRLSRLKRAEAGFLASRMQSLQRDRDWKAHLARRTRVDAFRDYTPGRKLKDLLARQADPSVVHYSGTTPEGDINSPDSPEKYAAILRRLKSTRDIFLLMGFKAIAPANLKLVFGDGANCLGTDLFSSLEACRTDFEKQPPETQEFRSKYLLEALDEEIRYFEKEFHLYREREVEVSPQMADAQLLPSSEDLDRIIRGETHLERLIELKRQQLFEWREEKRDAAAVGSVPIQADYARANTHEHDITLSIGKLRAADTNGLNRKGVNLRP